MFWVHVISVFISIIQVSNGILYTEEVVYSLPEFDEAIIGTFNQQFLYTNRSFTFDLGVRGIFEINLFNFEPGTVVHVYNLFDGGRIERKYTKHTFRHGNGASIPEVTMHIKYHKVGIVVQSGETGVLNFGTVSMISGFQGTTYIDNIPAVRTFVGVEAIYHVFVKENLIIDMKNDGAYPVEIWKNTVEFDEGKQRIGVLEPNNEVSYNSKWWKTGKYEWESVQFTLYSVGVDWKENKVELTFQQFPLVNDESSSASVITIIAAGVGILFPGILYAGSKLLCKRDSNLTEENGTSGEDDGQEMTALPVSMDEVDDLTELPAATAIDK